MLTCVILGALTVVLVLVVIGLVVIVSKLQTGTFSVTDSILSPVEMILTFSVCWKTDQMFSLCHIAVKEDQNPEQREVNTISI